MCELSGTQNHKNQNKSSQYLSPVGFPFPNINGNVCTANIIEEKDPLRVMTEEKKDLGGSMGPLLNGAWAYDHTR